MDEQQQRDDDVGPGPEFVTLLGGPLDGYRVPVTGWTPQQRAIGVAHLTDRGTYGPGGRAMYGPAPEDPDPSGTDRWVWEGDCP